MLEINQSGFNSFFFEGDTFFREDFFPHMRSLDDPSWDMVRSSLPIHACRIPNFFQPTAIHRGPRLYHGSRIPLALQPPLMPLRRTLAGFSCAPAKRPSPTGSTPSRSTCDRTSGTFVLFAPTRLAFGTDLSRSQQSLISQVVKADGGREISNSFASDHWWLVDDYNLRISLLPLSKVRSRAPCSLLLRY